MLAGAVLERDAGLLRAAAAAATATAAPNGRALSFWPFSFSPPPPSSSSPSPSSSQAKALPPPPLPPPLFPSSVVPALWRSLSLSRDPRALEPLLRAAAALANVEVKAGRKRSTAATQASASAAAPTSERVHLLRGGFFAPEPTEERAAAVAAAARREAMTAGERRVDGALYFPPFAASAAAAAGGGGGVSGGGRSWLSEDASAVPLVVACDEGDNSDDEASTVAPLLGALRSAAEEALETLDLLLEERASSAPEATTATLPLSLLPPLAALAAGTHPGLRVAASRALRAMGGDEDAARSLAALLSSPESSAAASAAVTALVAAGAPAASSSSRSGGRRLPLLFALGAGRALSLAARAVAAAAARWDARVL